MLRRFVFAVAIAALTMAVFLYDPNLGVLYCILLSFPLVFTWIVAVRRRRAGRAFTANDKAGVVGILLSLWPLLWGLVTGAVRMLAWGDLPDVLVLGLAILGVPLLVALTVFAVRRSIRCGPWRAFYAWTLLVLSLLPVLGIGLTFGGGVQQHVAAAKIRWAGGMATRTMDPRGPSGPNYVVFAPRATDADLASLHVLTGVWHLDLIDTRISDAGLTHLRGLPRLQALSLSGTKIRGPGLTNLTNLAQLYRLDLSRTQMGDAGSAYLGTCSQVSMLDLSDTPLTDEGLLHLRGLPKLERLDLSETPISGTGLAHLSALSGLRELTLSRTQLSDEGLASVRQIPQLRDLDLSDTRIGDAGLAHFAGFTSFSAYRLVLSGTKVTDAGLAHLVGLKRLKILHLGGTQLTDAGLVHLSQMTNLNELKIGDTNVTAAGRDLLKAELPACGF